MTDTINSYFAVLLITIAGAGAALLIIHVANSDATVAVYGSSAVYYNNP